MKAVILLYILFLGFAFSEKQETLLFYPTSTNEFKIDRDLDADTASITTEDAYRSKYTLSDKISLQAPSVLKELIVTYSSTKNDVGLFSSTKILRGLHLRIKFENQVSLTEVCDVLTTLLPCVSFLQCPEQQVDAANSFGIVNFNNTVWTTENYVPDDFDKSVRIMDKSLLTMANLIVEEYTLLNHTSTCFSSLNTNFLTSANGFLGYHSSEKAKLNHFTISFSPKQENNFFFEDCYTLEGPSTVSHISQSLASHATRHLAFYKHLSASHNLIDIENNFISNDQSPYSLWSGSIKTDIFSTRPPGGLHNSLFITLQLLIKENKLIDQFSDSITHVGFLLYLPKTAYVDLDELDNLRNKSRYHISYVAYERFIDIERPSSASTPHLIFIFMDTNYFNANSEIHMEGTFIIPIHFRYQDPHPTEAYQKSYIIYPGVFLHNNFIDPNETKWRSASFLYLKDSCVVKDVPVGKLTDGRIVEIFTFLITGVATLFLVKDIFKKSTTPLEI
ncbi:hypothetical protein WA158_002706 [Blastocystis sp. Blastoise]